MAELAGIRYDPDDLGRSDLDLERREIHVRGKAGKDRVGRIDHEAWRSGRGRVSPHRFRHHYSQCMRFPCVNQATDYRTSCSSQIFC